MSTTILLTDESGPDRQDLARYRAEGGYVALERALRSGAPGAVIDQVEAAGLRGRGGASFPTARKWRLAAAAAAPERHVVANGGEHEPGSRKDKHLVARYPHKVLEGLMLCALATGARHGWIYLIEDMEPQIAAAEAAIVELHQAGLLGDDILGTAVALDVRVHRAPTTYVAGEETAAIDAIDGGEGKPREKPPYPGERGIGGLPTTVNNVETLAHVPWILRHGADAYRAIGTPDSPGTMLFTLGPEVKRPGVFELPFGATYRQLIEEHGHGTVDGRAVRALLPALSCAFLRAEHLDGPISHEALRELGTAPGCGGVHLVLDGDDVLAKLLEIARFFAQEQCGQCPPCRMETNQFAHVLSAVEAGTPGDFLGQMRKIAAFTRGKGKCSLIEMAAAPILSGAALFRADLEARFRR